MRNLVLVLLALVAPLPAGAQLNADYLFRPGVIAATVMAGGVAFSDFRREAVWMATDQPFERRLSASTSVLASAGVSYWFARHFGFRLHAAYAPSRFEVRSTESYALREERSELDATPLSRLDVWMYDADLLVRMPFTLGRVEPYGVLGAGAVEYRLRTGDDEMVPQEVAAAFDGQRQRELAGVIGLGAVVPLERHRLLLNFELTDHVTRTPLHPRPLPGDAVDPESFERIDEVGYTNNVRLSIGLTLPLRVR